MTPESLSHEEKIDKIYENLGGGNPAHVAQQINDIHDAVKEGDATVMAKVLEVNSRLSAVEKWTERVKGAAGLGTFILGPGVILAVVGLIVMIYLNG